MDLQKNRNDRYGKYDSQMGLDVTSPDLYFLDELAELHNLDFQKKVILNLSY